MALVGARKMVEDLTRELCMIGSVGVQEEAAAPVVRKPARATKALPKPMRPAGAKRQISAEGRERIAAAQRKRWAKARRAGKGA
jgi:hypothetical protein